MPLDKKRTETGKLVMGEKEDIKKMLPFLYIDRNPSRSEGYSSPYPASCIHAWGTLPRRHCIGFLRDRSADGGREDAEERGHM